MCLQVYDCVITAIRMETGSGRIYIIYATNFLWCIISTGNPRGLYTFTEGGV